MTQWIGSVSLRVPDSGDVGAVMVAPEDVGEGSNVRVLASANCWFLRIILVDLVRDGAIRIGVEALFSTDNDW